MNGYGAIGQEHINDLLREASRERVARQTRRSRKAEHRSVTRVVMTAIHAVVRH
jgi:hypothetical protein